MSQAVARQYLEQIMRETGMSGAALAREAGIAPSTINRVLNDPNVKHTLSLRTMLKIEKATGVPIPANLLKPRQSTVTPMRKISVAPTPNASQDKNSFYPNDPRRDLSMAGTIDSVTGELTIRTTMGATLVERPASLVGRQGYCVTMNDGSMYPVYSEGFPLYVDEDRAPVAGDDIVVRFKDGRALIRRFVERTPKAIVCHQFSPDGDITFAVDTILSLDLIVANGRLRL
jgi:phage repressor protein C with HTH and peptisase S24 domain